MAYNTQEERLKVQGSEQVTRDFKVNGDVFVGGNLTLNNTSLANALTKLDGIEPGAEVNVQADWNQTDTSADDYIKNKPTIPPGVVVVDTIADGNMNAVTSNAVYNGVTKINLPSFIRNTSFPTGDRVRAMCVFNNKLFIGTDLNLYVTSDGATITSTSFGAGVNALVVFNNKMYVGKTGATYEALWETSDGTTFTLNSSYGNFMDATFGISGACEIGTFYVDGSNLYIGTMDSTQGVGNGVIRTSNGTSFSKFANNNSIGVSAICKYAGKIFVSSLGGNYYVANQTSEGTTYTRVTTFSKDVKQFYIYEGCLFACCINDRNNPTLYKSFDGYNFTEINVEHRQNLLVSNCIDYYGKLYVAYAEGIGILRQTGNVELVSDISVFRSATTLQVYNNTLYVGLDGLGLYTYKLDVSPFVQQLLGLLSL